MSGPVKDIVHIHIQCPVRGDLVKGVQCMESVEWCEMVSSARCQVNGVLNGVW